MRERIQTDEHGRFVQLRSGERVELPPEVPDDAVIVQEEGPRIGGYVSGGYLGYNITQRRLDVPGFVAVWPDTRSRSAVVAEYAGHLQRGLRPTMTVWEPADGASTKQARRHREHAQQPGWIARQARESGEHLARG